MLQRMKTSAERYRAYGHADRCLNGLDDGNAELLLQRCTQRRHAGAACARVAQRMGGPPEKRNGSRLSSKASVTH